MEIKFKSKVAASVFAALLFGGVMETADAFAPAPKLRIAEGILVKGDHKPYYTGADGVHGKDEPVLVANSPEEKLFIALDEKLGSVTAPILKNNSIWIPNSQGLKKNLKYYIDHGIDAEFVNARTQQAVYSKISNTMAKIEKEEAAHKSDKANKVREGVKESTKYLSQITEIITTWNEKGYSEELITQLKESLTAIKMDSFTNKIDAVGPDGGSKNALKDNQEAISKLRDALVGLFAIFYQSTTSTEFFHNALMHFALSDLDNNKELGRVYFNACKNLDSELDKKYEAFLKDHHLKSPLDASVTENDLYDLEIVPKK